MIQIRLLKDWQTKRAGEIINISESGANQFIKEGVGEVYNLEKVAKEEAKYQSAKIILNDDGFYKPQKDSKGNLIFKDTMQELLVKEKGFDSSMANRYLQEEELETVKNDKTDKIVVMSKFSPVPWAEKIMEEYSFLYDKFSRFWRYDSQIGIWKEDAENFIKYYLRQSLFGDELQKSSYCDEVIKYIRDSNWCNIDPTVEASNLIAFKNCIFNLDTEEIVEFNRKYFITSKIDIELDGQNNDCSAIDFFFEELVGKENKITLYELIAYCLLRDYPYQKFWILHGIGKNGKSAYLNLIRKIIGNENISCETPQNLSARPFSVGNLWNRLANISSDIPYTQLENLNTLKELTGNDVVNCERKYKDAFGFKNYAKLIFSGNELPQVNDKSYAFYRRVYIIQFNRQIENPNPHIIEQICTENNLSALAWKLIQVLKDMKKRNYEFTINPNESEMRILYEDLSNPLNRYIKECCEIDRDESIVKFEFAEAFNSWLLKKGLRVWGEKEIIRNMGARFHETRKEVSVFDKSSNSIVSKYYRAWEGLKFKKLTTSTI
jgi:putative DNA primase/helicase